MGKTNKYRWNLWHKWTIPTNNNIHKLKIDARYMDGIEKYGWNHNHGWKWPSWTFIYLLMWGLHMKLPPSPINLLPSLLGSPTYLPSRATYIVKIMMYVYEVYIYTYRPLQIHLGIERHIWRRCKFPCSYGSHNGNQKM